MSQMTKLKENLPMIFTFSVIACLLLYAYGCQPKTRSLLDPYDKVDRKTLLFEMNSLVHRYETGVKDLDTQERIRNIIFQQGLIVAQGGTINVPGLIITLLGVFGIGVTVDDVKNRRKLKDVANKMSPDNQ